MIAALSFSCWEVCSILTMVSPILCLERVGDGYSNPLGSYCELYMDFFVVEVRVGGGTNL